MKNKANINVEEQLKSKKGWEKVLMIVGGLCFVSQGAFLILHLGFVDESIHHGGEAPQFLSRANLWYLHIGLGILGGILLDVRSPLTAAFAGMVAAIAITGTGLLYLSWRESILNVELIIPLLAGLLTGVPLNSALKNLFRKGAAKSESPDPPVE